MSDSVAAADFADFKGQDHYLTLALPYAHITSYAGIPKEAIDAIEQVIKFEEGGWQLTNNPHDHGGFTYGGMTFAVLHNYLPNLSLDDLVRFKAKLPLLNTMVIRIYYHEYFLSIDNLTKDANLLSALLSCAINCGPGSARIIYNASRTYKIPGQTWDSTKYVPTDVVAFCMVWLHHYIDICVKDHTQVVFLSGALNRVEKYIGMGALKSVVKSSPFDPS